MPDYDVIAVGAGHNALITSAYLAQAGYRVAVFERRDMVGGAVATTEIVPGYKFDLGGSAHILIRLTPVIEELGLARYGLRYLEIDPLFLRRLKMATRCFFTATRLKPSSSSRRSSRERVWSTSDF